MASVVHIFIAPIRGAPMEPRQVVAALTDGGLDGDRYADPANRRGPDYQVTLIESENIAAFSEMVEVPFTPDMPRRNIVTQGVRLNELCGRRFKVGGATLEGLELCEPCSLFAKRTHRDVLKYFPRKGGLRARIVVGGKIHIGDLVVVDA
jgi:MOSC domain-containing protein YiiM